MQTRTVFVAAIVAVACVFGLQYCGVVKTTGTVAENVYQKVREAGVIRCGYLDEAPFTMTDPKTGKRTGIAVDVIESIAARNGLRVEWAEPIVIGTFLQDLANKRYDAVCGSVFAIARGKGEIDYTIPYAYAAMGAYVRQGDQRFDGQPQRLNDPAVKFAVIDGEGATQAKRQIFPLAGEYALPQNSDISPILLAVAGHKADVGLVLKSVFAGYAATNPGILDEVKLDKPLYTFPIAFGLRTGEHSLRQFFDNNLRGMIASGELDVIYQKYKLQLQGILPPQRPF